MQDNENEIEQLMASFGLEEVWPSKVREALERLKRERDEALEALLELWQDVGGEG